MNHSFPRLFLIHLKFPDFYTFFQNSLTGKSCLIFPCFPVPVETLLFIDGSSELCGGLRSFHRLRGISPVTNGTAWSKKCYYFGKTKTFRHASHACKRKVNGRLAEFPDMEEYEIVKTYLESNKPGIITTAAKSINQLFSKKRNSCFSKKGNWDHFS